MLVCVDFIKVRGLIHKEYLTYCDICVHMLNNFDCKINGVNNKTSIVHEEVKMVFEIGKYYEHTTGSRLFICGAISSYSYGIGLVAENEYAEFIRVGSGEDNASNYKEITKEKFLSPSTSARYCTRGECVPSCGIILNDELHK